MKKLIAITLILVALASVASAEQNIYLRFGNVVDLEYSTDCVTVDDGLGNLWEYFGVDYVFYGDLVVMIMSDNGTPDWIYDDIVLNAYKCTEGEAEDLIMYIRNDAPTDGFHA